MMKKLFFLFVAAALCLSLCACEKKQPDSPTVPGDEQRTDAPEQNPEDSQTPPADKTGEEQPAPEDNAKPDEENQAGDPQNPNEWPKTGIAKRIPSPEAGKIYQITDERTFFRADILETDAEYVKSYAEKCKNSGFNLNVSEDAIDSSTYIFTAENEKGYRLHISYTGILIITIAAPQ